MAKTRPIKTTAPVPPKIDSSLVLPVAGLFLTTIAIVFLVLQIMVAVKKTIPPDYAAQIKSHDQTRTNIEQLINFITAQRDQLAASQQALADLKSEEDRLQPLVTADRKVIDGILREQEARSQQEQVRQTKIGFGLGVLASLTAAFIWSIGANLHKRWKAAPATPIT